MFEVIVFDYGVGNIRSFINVFKFFGYNVKFVKDVKDILSVERFIFLGVGVFGSVMVFFESSGFVELFKKYI